MDSESWIELAIAACNQANIKPGAIETIATWDQAYCANAVYRINGQQYLKLFGPTAERQFHIERALLRILEAHPAIPAPRIVAAGERASGPPYLLLTGIPGNTAENVWDELERSQQLAPGSRFRGDYGRHPSPAAGKAGCHRAAVWRAQRTHASLEGAMPYRNRDGRELFGEAA